ncbi:hypothetical protein [Paenibacillus sp. DMB20]|uniref:hypothetical protein n=1 Tax=Paenibacillus sp. DMB20 TaxID=1642570 RepID=UPI000628164D|nr:hypothetical protein [Paenibacillus sp. DMB20]KKO51718.1 hypothetical protein XI25_23505 [Paenibacillus sp. DMB20]
MKQLQTQNREYLLSINDMGKRVTYSNTMGETFQNPSLIPSLQIEESKSYSFLESVNVLADHALNP